jgi:ATP synthase protein I
MNDPEKPRSDGRMAEEKRALEELEARLLKARGDKPDVVEESGSQARATAMGIAWRLAIEIVVAPAVCGTLGWWLDRWLGTKPWLFVVLVVLGLAAGMLNAIRVAQRANR